MFPRRSFRWSFQRGVGLPAAIFVITLMATLAVGINRLVMRNAGVFQEEVNLARAFYAAESGAGFAMNALFPPEDFPDYDIASACPDNEESPWLYEFTAQGLNACTASVSCTNDATVDEMDYYTIVSTGTCDGVSRKVQVRTSF